MTRFIPWLLVATHIGQVVNDTAVYSHTHIVQVFNDTAVYSYTHIVQVVNDTVVTYTMAMSIPWLPVTAHNILSR